MITTPNLIWHGLLLFDRTTVVIEVLRVHDGVVGYTNTFIAVAEDCRAATGEVPLARAGDPTVASAQYAMLAAPGRWTQEDVLLASSPQVRGQDIDGASSAGYDRSTSASRAHAFAPLRCRRHSVGDCTTTPTAGSRCTLWTPGVRPAQ